LSLASAKYRVQAVSSASCGVPTGLPVTLTAIVLAAARGHRNARIAGDLGIDEGTVRKWRGRFAELRLAGLRDLPRCGRPRPGLRGESPRSRRFRPPRPGARDAAGRGGPADGP
jgi:hypothetical protein